MPPKSEAQRGLMHSAMAGQIPDISPAVAREFLKHDKGGKLPKRVGKKAKKKGKK